MSGKLDNILVIRYGALGDMIYCFQSFHEIRLAHPHAHITLLTAPAFVGFAKRMPWFDEVMADPHPSKHRIDQWWRLGRDLRALRPTRVYELHGKLRQSILFWLMGGVFAQMFGKLEWSGAARFASHPRLWPPQPNTHFRDFLASQLRLAGVAAQSAAPLDWLNAPIDSFTLPERYAVIIPGCTAGQNYKRWPPQKYAAVVQHLVSKGLPVIAIGTKADADAIRAVKQNAPELIDLCGKSDLFQLAGILRHAACIIGNDTGPMHMGAALGAPTLALLSGSTDPVWSAPPVANAQWLKHQPIADLPLDKVLLALESLLAHKT